MGSKTYLGSKKMTTHPDIAQAMAAIPLSPTMKGMPAYSLLVKVLGN